MKYTTYQAVVTPLKIMPVNSDFQVKMMEQNQQEERETAAQEFEAALDELEEILQDKFPEAKTKGSFYDGSVSDAQLAQEEQDLASIDIAAFEDAVADIEQYLAERYR
ncbi:MULTISPECIES: hypothetical protein [Calothrix]|nr:MULTISPECIES: hypothetical protein [Calothrix]